MNAYAKQKPSRSLVEGLRQSVRTAIPRGLYKKLARWLDRACCLVHLRWKGYRRLWSLLPQNASICERLVSLGHPFAEAPHLDPPWN